MPGANESDLGGDSVEDEVSDYSIGRYSAVASRTSSHSVCLSRIEARYVDIYSGSVSVAEFNDAFPSNVPCGSSRRIERGGIGVTLFGIAGDRTQCVL